MSSDGVHLLAGREKERGDPQLMLLLAPVRFLTQRTSLRLTHGTWRPREGWALPEDTEPTPLPAHQGHVLTEQGLALAWVAGGPLTGALLLLLWVPFAGVAGRGGGEVGGPLTFHW